ncbi:MAG: BrnT family toxin [Pseudomonadota bacterium]|nr:BrnT family toxin [Pseudomonadota bacterium]
MQELHLFSWDHAKNESNQRKHGVSFEAAKLVFDDPLHVSRQDRIENGEQRWQTIGMAGGVALLLVAHTWNETESSNTDCATEHIRIISARRATKLERNVYEQDA